MSIINDDELCVENGESFVENDENDENKVFWFEAIVKLTALVSFNRK